MLPNFIILGAQKAATTSLHTYVNQHPDIYMSPQKEPLYFMASGMEKPGNNAITDLQEYQNLFEGRTNEKILGESSPIYLACPWSPRLIHETIPEVKMIAVLRNPIERAWSQFKMHQRKGVTMYSGNFSEALKQHQERRRGDEVWHTSYVEIGMYYQQLQRYYQYFKRDQLKVFLYDDLIKDPARVLVQIFEFLGVDQQVEINVDYRRNTASGKKKSFWNKLFSSKSPAESKLSDTDRSTLNGLFEAEINQLAALLGRDLNHWIR